MIIANVTVMQFLTFIRVSGFIPEEMKREGVYEVLCNISNTREMKCTLKLELGAVKWGEPRKCIAVHAHQSQQPSTGMVPKWREVWVDTGRGELQKQSTSDWVREPWTWTTAFSSQPCGTQFWTHLNHLPPFLLLIITFYMLCLYLLSFFYYIISFLLSSSPRSSSTVKRTHTMIAVLWSPITLVVPSVL